MYGKSKFDMSNMCTYKILNVSNLLICNELFEMIHQFQMSPKSVTSTMIVMTAVTSGFLYILPIIILPFIYLR